METNNNTTNNIEPGISVWTEEDDKITRVEFTAEMKKDYKILLPTMLPRHLKMIASLLKVYGYDAEMLENTGQNVIDTGLMYVHNDTCYPATLVVGQFVDALNSGKYDLNKTALLFTQTGGGCRASNYISLMRKALKKAGYGHIPVISLNFVGLEKNSGFKLTIPMIIRMLYAIVYGDVIMCVCNQAKAYEVNKGDSEKLADEWTAKLVEQLAQKHITYGKVKKTIRQMVREFEAIPKTGEKKEKVGIVGEIYVKFSPLANRYLEDYLLSEGAEPTMAGLVDFAMFYVYGRMEEYKMYRIHKKSVHAFRIAYKLMEVLQNDIIKIIKEESSFDPPTEFKKTVELARDYIHLGVKMGEGWLLVAEMVEHIHRGTKSIVCTQPFGCLPNHIVGKGVTKLIKERNPDVNIVAIDYDASASEINQQNRLKLLLANAENSKFKI
ncbi:MAG: 2-hydroxyacyl-CoA dehydratase [Lachnospiraceae bacterium]|nr:2-hydroxyacyl-CoA dehydratase [Lachnospiraceae bacterium]